MELEFEDEWNRKIYVDWTATLHELFGGRMYVHYDLYEATHKHRIEHNQGFGGGACSAWPSPPYRAPLWPLLAEILQPLRFLEVGCGLGYTAALMAEAGGPSSRIDTIELDPVHADMAENLLAQKGLANRVRVLRGDAADIVPSLTGPYDLVFVDGGDTSTMPHPARGTAVIDKQVLYQEVERIVCLIKKSAGMSLSERQELYSAAEEMYRKAATNAVLPR